MSSPYRRHWPKVTADAEIIKFADFKKSPPVAPTPAKTKSAARPEKIQARRQRLANAFVQAEATYVQAALRYYRSVAQNNLREYKIELAAGHSKRAQELLQMASKQQTLIDKISDGKLSPTFTEHDPLQYLR